MSLGLSRLSVKSTYSFVIIPLRQCFSLFLSFHANCLVCMGDLDCSTRSTRRCGPWDAIDLSRIEMEGQALAAWALSGEALVELQVSHAALR